MAVLTLSNSNLGVLGLGLLPQVSLTRSPPLRSTDVQGEGLLFNSYDRTLVVKQISSEDVADMHSILSEYHQVRAGVFLIHGL